MAQNTSEKRFSLVFFYMNSFPFATLERPVTLQGVGLHSGQKVTVTLSPRKECGLVFKRADLPSQPLIAASWEAVASTHHATTLQVGEATVSTVEHLLAALSAFGITHCEIALDGPEVPILDGSAQPWCELLREAGLETLSGLRPIWRLTEPVWVEGEGGASMLGLPLESPRSTPHSSYSPLTEGWPLSCAVDFGAGYRQVVEVAVTGENFEHQLAPARTFAREEWLSALRERGLIRGGTADNALVLRANGPLSAWRLPMELAAHKALDVVGDLALLTAPAGAFLAARIIVIRAGHGVHRAWIAQARQQDAFTSV